MKRFGPAASGMLLGSLFLVQAPAQAAGVHSLELNLRYYDFDYEEDLPYPLKSTEQSWIPDLEVNYYYQGTDNNFYGRIIFDYGDAQTDYDGSTQSGIPAQTVTDNVLITGEVNVGYTFANDVSPIAFILYTGAGQRYWERDLQGPGGVTEDYTLRYFPIGLRTLFTIDDRWKGALDISARINVDGDMKIHFARQGWQDATVNLGGSMSWKIELPFLYQYSNHWSFAVTPWYEQIEITKSDWVSVYDLDGNLIGYAMEPSSTTQQYGMKLGARYFF